MATLPLQSRQAALPALALVLLFALFAGRLWLLPAQMSLDTNEGWNAFQAQAAMGGGVLYPGAEALNSNNYPPLSFYIVGLLGRALGDMVLAGRFVALTSLISVGVMAFVLVNRLVPRNRQAPWMAVLIFAGYNATAFRAYVAINDPQWLGHALMMAGLLVLLWHRRIGPAPIHVALGSGLLVLAGGLVKHNLVALPGAVGIWLLIHDRRTLAVWSACAMAGLLALLVCDQLLFGNRMMIDILAPDRTYSLKHMAINGAVILLFLPLLITVYRKMPRRPDDPRLSLPIYGLMLAVPIGLLESLGDGVDVNAHFESLVMLSIAFPIALAQGGSKLPQRAIQWLGVAVAAWSGAANAHELAGCNAAIAETRALVTRIAAAQGAAACETPAICYWAGKRTSVDFFANGERLKARHDLAPIDTAIRRHDFALIQLEAHPDGSGTGRPVDQLVLQRYRPVEVHGLKVLLAP